MKTQDIKRIVVGLSHTYLDAEVIHYMNFIAHTTQVEHIYYVHIIDVRLPENVLKQFPDLEQAALEDRRKEIEAVVEKHLDKALVTCDYSIEIEQSSNSLKGLSRVVGKFDADLIVIGRVANKDKNSIITQRLARRAPCQLLIVPEGQAARIAEGKKLSTILVPIDFSD